MSQRWSYTARTDTNCILWIISRHTFFEHAISEENIDNLRHNVPHIPRQNTLRGICAQMDMWKKFKGNLLSDLVYSKRREKLPLLLGNNHSRECYHIGSAKKSLKPEYHTAHRLAGRVTSSGKDFGVLERYLSNAYPNITLNRQGLLKTAFAEKYIEVKKMRDDPAYFTQNMLAEIRKEKGLVINDASLAKDMSDNGLRKPEAVPHTSVPALETVVPKRPSPDKNGSRGKFLGRAKIDRRASLRQRKRRIIYKANGMGSLEDDQHSTW
eukprot:g1757.t1